MKLKTKNVIISNILWYFPSSFDKGRSADSKTESQFTPFSVPKYFSDQNKIKVYN